MVRAQAGLELRILLRNGEQLLLTLIIPVLLLLAFGHENLIRRCRAAGSTSWCPASWPSPSCRRPSPARPSAPASSAGTACSSGSARRRCRASGLIAAKTVTVLAVELVQVVLVSGDRRAARLAAARRAGGRDPVSPLLLVAGTAAFSGLALLMAGHAAGRGDAGRGEPAVPDHARARRGAVPADEVPRRASSRCCELLPAGALSDGLRAVLGHGGGCRAATCWCWCIWAVAAIAVAARFFRWE